MSKPTLQKSKPRFRGVKRLAEVRELAASPPATLNSLGGCRKALNRRQKGVPIVP
jgi:hypothetical protein